MNHTPTPTPTPYAYRMEGDSMAIIFHQTPTGEQRITRTASVLGEANAAFIVQACNAHEALIEQLQFMADHFSYKMSHEMQTKLDAVLKLANAGAESEGE